MYHCGLQAIGWAELMLAEAERDVKEHVIAQHG
jgi:hypothetical protein